MTALAVIGLAVVALGIPAVSTHAYLEMKYPVRKL